MKAPPSLQTTTLVYKPPGPVFRYGVPILQVGSETKKPTDNLKQFTGTQTTPHFTNIFFHHLGYKARKT